MPGKIRSLASLVAVILGATTLVASPAGHAQSMTLHQEFQFGGPAGTVPLAGNLLYNNQQIYGAAYGGGEILANGVLLGGVDLGAIFQYAASGTSPRSPTALYAFSGPDGAHPNGSLVADALGNLYGTTGSGGANNLGTVFKLAPPTAAGGTWTLTTLHSFAGPDGANPGAGVTIGPNGALYGTTMSGGPPAMATGVVFTLSTSGTMFRVITPLYPGIGSRSSLIFDPAGNILGTTYRTAVARAAGSLFKIAPNGTYTAVAQFQYSEAFNGISTANPIGNIVRDAAGNIYGMLGTAVRIVAYSPVATGAAVYKVTAATRQLTILTILNGQTAQSGIVRDAAGNLYGTTANGGSTGTGSVFALSPGGTVTTLASLSSANLAPAGGVIADPTGKLWGTSSAGGNLSCGSSSNVTPTGCGTLFSLSR